MKNKFLIKQMLKYGIEKKITQNKRDMNSPSNLANRLLILGKKSD
jgi:hypothetical protein